MLKVLRLASVSLLAAGVASGGCAGSGGPDKNALPVSCLAKPDPGPCRRRQLKFYFDYSDNRCKAFSYGGCAGLVPFESMRECRERCGAD